MKKVTITRNKQLVGCKMRCWIVMNMNEDEARKYMYRAIHQLPDQSKDIIPIQNGQSVVLELNDNQTEFYAVGTAAWGFKAHYSNKVMISADSADRAYLLHLHIYWTTLQQEAGTVLQLTEV